MNDSSSSIHSIETAVARLATALANVARVATLEASNVAGRLATLPVLPDAPESGPLAGPLAEAHQALAEARDAITASEGAYLLLATQMRDALQTLTSHAVPVATDTATDTATEETISVAANPPAGDASEEQDPTPMTPATEATDTEQTFTTGEVAKICKVRTADVSRWFDAGKLSGTKTGKTRRIPKSALLAFMTDHGMPVPADL